MPAPTGWSDTDTAPPGGTVVAAVHKRYGRRGPAVLRGVDLVLAPGTVTEVVGGNGSGKTTLLRIVAGLSRPSSGRVERRPPSVAYAPERLPARLRMSARAYVGHMARLRGLDPSPAEELLERLALAPGPDVPIGTLSKGNSQKVALAQALAAPVGLLLLDEPIGGLDEAARAALRTVLAERRSDGAAVLTTAHQPSVALEPDATFELRDGVLAPVTAARRPTTMRIELAAPADGATRVVEVPGDESDAMLAAALAEGWSVVSVRAT